VVELQQKRGLERGLLRRQVDGQIVQQSLHVLPAPPRFFLPGVRRGMVSPCRHMLAPYQLALRRAHSRFGPGRSHAVV